MGISQLPLPPVFGSRIEKLTSTGTWTAPSGVKFVFLTGFDVNE